MTKVRQNLRQNWDKIEKKKLRLNWDEIEIKLTKLKKFDKIEKKNEIEAKLR